MKTTLYFMLKVLFVEIFTFLSWHFGYVEKQLDKKAMVKSKFLISQTGQQIITIYMLPNMLANMLPNPKK